MTSGGEKKRRKAAKLSCFYSLPACVKSFLFCCANDGLLGDSLQVFSPHHSVLSLKILIKIKKIMSVLDHLDVASRLCADKVGFVKYKIRLASVQLLSMLYKN